MSLPASKNIVFIATLITALGCGLMGGVFFAFSSFVMKALGRIPASEGIGAMQYINVLAVRSWFLVAFMGTAIACLVLGINALWRLNIAAGAFTIAGSAAYLIGAFLITASINVPLNDSLARLTPSDPTAAAAWANYLAVWTSWNHVRAVACLIASALLTSSLLWQKG